MSTNDHENLNDLELWRAVRRAGSNAKADEATGLGEERAGEPDPLTLAAYLDGHADESEAAEVEAWLLTQADPAEVLAELRGLSDLPLQMPAVDLVANAKALVDAGAAKEAAATASEQPIELHRWRSVSGWLATAAAVAIAAWVGFDFGQATATPQGAQVVETQPDADTVEALAMDLIGAETDPLLLEDELLLSVFEDAADADDIFTEGGER